MRWELGRAPDARDKLFEASCYKFPLFSFQLRGEMFGRRLQMEMRDVKEKESQRERLRDGTDALPSSVRCDLHKPVYQYFCPFPASQLPLLVVVIVATRRCSHPHATLPRLRLAAQGQQLLRPRGAAAVPEPAACGRD